MTFMITTQNHYFTDSERPLSQTYSYQEATKHYQKLNSGYQNEMKYQYVLETIWHLVFANNWRVTRSEWARKDEYKANNV